MAIKLLKNQLLKMTGILLLVILICTGMMLIILFYWPQNNLKNPVTIKISKGATLNEITDVLSVNEIVSNEKMFLIAVKLMGYSNKLPAGVFSLENSKSNIQIVRQLAKGEPASAKITLLEGWTIKEIAQELSNSLGISAEENAKVILQQMVNKYKNIFTETLRNRAKAIGLTETEVITLASIIEGEAVYDSERPMISAVYHNRLKKRMRLQADPTIQYIIKDGPRRVLLSDLKIDSPYNTYLNYGLPPGPISNPGKQSILAALYPDENDYLFFVARGDGYHNFTRTIEEHNRAKRAFQKVRKAANQG